MRIILIPAYGRKYNTKQEMLNDWNSGKDFHIVQGAYCSVRDITNMMRDFNFIEIVWIDDSGTKPDMHILFDGDIYDAG